MGLDSYIFKVKAPSNEQMRQVKYCTWDDIKEKLKLTAIAVDDFMTLPDELKALSVCAKPGILSRTVFQFESWCSDHGVDEKNVGGWWSGPTGLSVFVRDGEDSKEVHITPEEIKSYEAVIQQQVLLISEEQVQYWRKNYKVQDYFYETYDVDNCKYVEISRDDLKYIRDRIDAYTSVPKLAEDEHLFYYEWY